MKSHGSINIDWCASWDCPKCGSYTEGIDPNVNDEGDHFEVSCECGLEYTVNYKGSGMYFVVSDIEPPKKDDDA